MPPFSQLSLDARIAVDSQLRMQCGVACRNAKNDHSAASGGSASTPCSSSTAASPNRYSDNHETYPPEGYLLLTTIDKSLYTPEKSYRFASSAQIGRRNESE